MTQTFTVIIMQKKLDTYVIGVSCRFWEENSAERFSLIGKRIGNYRWEACLPLYLCKENP